MRSHAAWPGLCRSRTLAARFAVASSARLVVASDGGMGQAGGDRPSVRCGAVEAAAKRWGVAALDEQRFDAAVGDPTARGYARNGLSRAHHRRHDRTGAWQHTNYVAGALRHLVARTAL